MTVKVGGMTEMNAISQSVAVPKSTKGSAILPPLIVLSNVAITVLVANPTKEGGIAIMLMLILYGPLVPPVLIKLTLISYVPGTVEVVDVISTKNY